MSTVTVLPMSPRDTLVRPRDRLGTSPDVTDVPVTVRSPWFPRVTHTLGPKSPLDTLVPVPGGRTAREGSQGVFNEIVKLRRRVRAVGKTGKGRDMVPDDTPKVSGRWETRDEG